MGIMVATPKKHGNCVTLWCHLLLEYLNDFSSMYYHIKTLSSKPAISTIIEKPENEILLLKKLYQALNVIALYVNKVSLNASVNK